LERGALSGITLGVRNEAENLTMEAAYSRVLSSPAALEEKGHDFNFKVALKF
jgi:hemolysin activation/secretion protein